jgi:hypothetical protein
LAILKSTHRKIVRGEEQEFKIEVGLGKEE